MVMSFRTTRKIRKVMKAAWGEWQGPGKHEQLWIDSKNCDDGWATYCMRNQRKVAKIISNPHLHYQPEPAGAEWVYTEIRRIMRN
jgi:hypothetical protein